EIVLIEVTDFQVPKEDKVTVAASIGVHGNERAGVEGFARWVEDVVNWAADDPDHELRNGTNKDSTSIGARAALGKVHMYLSAINPDGWARGDAQNGGVFQRGNANGVDLNRKFPTKGWTKVTGRPLPLTEPEPIAWAEAVQKIDPVMSVDLHGELTSANNAFADIMLPAGQWNPAEQARHDRFARHMKSNIARWFEIQGVEMDTFTGQAGQKPAEYATGYDVVGYDDSGFMGDWFTEQIGAVDLDVEHFFSHYVPNSTWVAALEDAHIASVRGELETLLVEAPLIERVRPTMNLGRVGYLYDKKVVKSSDGYGGPRPPDGIDPAPYHATRMTYFKDLERFTTRPVRRVWSNRLRRGLRGLDTFVIADAVLPRARSGAKPGPRRFTRKLKRWVRAGGNLVLTDRALRWIGRLGVVGGKRVGRQVYGAGHVNILDFDDAYTRGVHSTASQTYYEVPLGFTLDEDSSPHWTVARAAWEKAGGKTIAYIEDEERVGVGRIKLGKGTIGIFGAVLPQPTERYDHLYGLADYAVSVAGGQILHNMMRFGAR
ncbi:MAG: M14 family metallopeptidase, partial [Actinomycetota bacterium]|nr:M14 family metallopeptidase [Actinomycetota bacterium]